MHLDESEQRRQRVEIVRQGLRRIGGIEELPKIEELESPRAVGYRSRARLSIEDGAIGFRAHASHRVVDVKRCLVLDPETQAELEACRSSAPVADEVEIRGHGPTVHPASLEARLQSRERVSGQPLQPPHVLLGDDARGATEEGLQVCFDAMRDPEGPRVG